MTISPQALVNVADELDRLKSENAALRKEVKSLRWMNGIWEGAMQAVTREKLAWRDQQNPASDEMRELAIQNKLEKK